MNRIQQQTERTRGKTFVVEERVYLRTDNIHVKRRSKKLNNKSIEPFKIKRNIKGLSYELDLPRKCGYTQYSMRPCFSVATSPYRSKPSKHLSNPMRSIRSRTS
jgi:hypothetical protein